MRHGRIVRLRRRDQPGIRRTASHPWHRAWPGIVLALALLERRADAHWRSLSVTRRSQAAMKTE